MGTKSNRSSGTQHNPKGITQGVTLVDPKSGNPIDSVTDSNGVRRIAVDGNFTAQNVQATVELDYQEDSVSIGDDVSGNKLKIEDDGSINANVEVDAADGDNIGLKVQQRGNSPSDALYNKRVTAKTGTGPNSDTTSMDMSIHDHEGNELTDRNPLQVSTNYEKIIQVVLKSAWMKLAVYDEVITTVSPDRSSINLSFKEDGYLIGEAIINFTSDLNWNFNLYRYLVDDDGSKLLDDDDTPLFLE